MTHLGTQVSALADGQLSSVATERALAHVAACEECATELRAARAARAALAAAMDVPPAPPELTARLLSLGSGCPPPTRHDALRSGARPALPLPGSGPRPAACLPPASLRGEVVRRRRTSVLAVLSGAGLGVAVAVLLVMGDHPSVSPSGHPAQALTMLGRAPTAAPTGPAVASVADQGVADRTVSWLRANGWDESRLPDGYVVTAVHPGGQGPGTVEVDLVGPHGTVVVTQREGHLSPEAAEVYPVEMLGGHAVVVVSTSPWHGVWQQGDTVVDLLAVSDDAAHDLLPAFPEEEYDAGVGARLARGFASLAGDWSP